MLPVFIVSFSPFPCELKCFFGPFMQDVLTTCLNSMLKETKETDLINFSKFKVGIFKVVRYYSTRVAFE